MNFLFYNGAMSKKREIAFWIIMGVISLLITALTLFYFDLANGPLICFILELIFIGAFVSLRIINNKYTQITDKYFSQNFP